MARTLESDSAPFVASPQDTRARRFALVRWPLAAGCMAGAIAWVSTDAFAWSRELFLVPYVASACILCAAFVRSERVDVGAALAKDPLRTVIVTVVTAALMITTVLLQRGAPRAQGARLVFEIGWDGIAYGAVDGLLLTVIPMAAVARARVAAGRATDALALFSSMFVYVVYHLGFPEFRGTGLVAPVVASITFGAAYLAARNPLAPIVAHAAMHTMAVLHGPAGTLQLPPHY
jgi:hypothetical protein